MRFVSTARLTAFDEIKEMSYVFCKIVVALDASGDEVGVVMLHKHDGGNMKSFAHASRSLLPTKKNYRQIEKDDL